MAFVKQEASDLMTTISETVETSLMSAFDQKLDTTLPVVSGEVYDYMKTSTWRYIVLSLYFLSAFSSIMTAYGIIVFLQGLAEPAI